jgi:hypothetical protein
MARCATFADAMPNPTVVPTGQLPEGDPMPRQSSPYANCLAPTAAWRQNGKTVRKVNVSLRGPKDDSGGLSGVQIFGHVYWLLNTIVEHSPFETRRESGALPPGERALLQQIAAGTPYIHNPSGAQYRLCLKTARAACCGPGTCDSLRAWCTAPFILSS